MSDYYATVRAEHVQQHMAALADRCERLERDTAHAREMERMARSALEGLRELRQAMKGQPEEREGGEIAPQAAELVRRLLGEGHAATVAVFQLKAEAEDIGNRLTRTLAERDRAVEERNRLARELAEARNDRALETDEWLPGDRAEHADLGACVVAQKQNFLGVEVVLADGKQFLARADRLKRPARPEAGLKDLHPFEGLLGARLTWCGGRVVIVVGTRAVNGVVQLLGRNKEGEVGTYRFGACDGMGRVVELYTREGK